MVSMVSKWLERLFFLEMLFPPGVKQTWGEPSKLNKAIKKITLNTSWLIFEPTFYFLLLFLSWTPLFGFLLPYLPAQFCSGHEYAPGPKCLWLFLMASILSTCAIYASPLASGSTHVPLTLQSLNQARIVLPISRPLYSPVHWAFLPGHFIFHI